MRKNPILILILAVLIFIAGITIIRNNVHFYNDPYIKQPTCDLGGGVYEKCILCGKENVIEVYPPNGHNGVWITRKEATAATIGEEELRCTVCKKQLDLVKVAPKESPIPSLRLAGSGVGMTDKRSISASFSYSNGVNPSSGDEQVTSGVANVRLKTGEVPDTSKHSYVLTNFKLTEGDTLLFGAFGDSKEIHLHSNNDDLTRSRRIVASRQWRDLVISNYPEYAKFIVVSDDTEYTGYNLLMYIKSTKIDYSFAGVYTLSIPYSTIAEKNTEANIVSVIRQVPSITHDHYISQIFGDAEKEEEYKNNLLLLLTDVKNAEKLSNINVLIDYYSFALLTGNADALNDLYWVTDDGIKWYPVPANTEHTYGSKTNSVDLSEPYTSLNSRGFWHDFSKEYHEQIMKRSKELSSVRLSPENIHKEFKSTIEKLVEEVYREDAKTYRAVYRSPESELEKLVKWYSNRLSYLFEQE